MIQPVSHDLREALGLPVSKGALISSVVEGSPAEKAGIVSGDVITTFDGDSILNASMLRNKISLEKPGTKVALTVFRNGKKLPMSVILSDIPGSDRSIPQVADPSMSFGLMVSPINHDLRKKYGLGNKTKGVVVTGIEYGSPFFGTELTEGDLIIEMNRLQIESIADYRSIIKNVRTNQVVLLLIERNSENKYIAVRI